MWFVLNTFDCRRCCRLKSVRSYRLIDGYTIHSLELDEKILLRAARILSSSTLLCFVLSLSLFFLFFLFFASTLFGCLFTVFDWIVGYECPLLAAHTLCPDFYYNVLLFGWGNNCFKVTKHKLSCRQEQFFSPKSLCDWRFDCKKFALVLSKRDAVIILTHMVIYLVARAWFTVSFFELTPFDS